VSLRPTLALSASGAAVLAGLLAGCGSASPDLFTVQRTGAIPGARVNLVVSDNGEVRCNGGSRRLMTDSELLQARQLQRDLSKDATGGLVLGPGRQSVLTYAVSTPAGHVRFSDTSPGAQPVLLRLAAFTREVATGVCRLPR
jgi:hypothetical protein